MMISLFDYLKKPAGQRLGKEVYKQAKKSGEKIKVRKLPFEYDEEGNRMVMLYDRKFLNKFFYKDKFKSFY